MEEKYFVQRESDGYFNATRLIDGWNKDGEHQLKQLNNYKKNLSTKLFIKKLKQEGIEKPMVAKHGYLSSGTWMHPKLFVDFAMWISADLKNQVIDYLLEGVIYRDQDGDYCNELGH